MTVSVNLLVPAATLIFWSLVMLFWMGIVRGRLFKAHDVDVGKTPGLRGQDLEQRLPGKAHWPAHNYVHLMEQPTIFYPAVLILAMLNQGNILNLALAWTYVLLRIVHSIWQAAINQVPMRAALFALSTFALLGLSLRALFATLAL